MARESFFDDAKHLREVIAETRKELAELRQEHERLMALMQAGQCPCCVGGRHGRRHEARVGSPAHAR